MKFHGPALLWLRLIQDGDGWLDEDERVIAAECEHLSTKGRTGMLLRIPFKIRRHLIRLGYIRETAYSDGSWRLDSTQLGRHARETEQIV